MLGDGEAHRDTRKPTERPLPRHAAARAEALDMREALGGKFLERGVQCFLFCHGVSRDPR